MKQAVANGGKLRVAVTADLAKDLQNESPSAKKLAANLAETFARLSRNRAPSVRVEFARSGKVLLVAEGAALHVADAKLTAHPGHAPQRAPGADPKLVRPGRQRLAVPAQRLAAQQQLRRRSIEVVAPPLLLARLGDHEDDRAAVALVADGDAVATTRSAAGDGEERQSRAQQPVRPRAQDRCEERVEVLEDVFPPSIEDTRRYQTLQALVNCTRKSLMPLEFQTIDSRKSFQQEILKLEGKGIS